MKNSTFSLVAEWINRRLFTHTNFLALARFTRGAECFLSFFLNESNFCFFSSLRVSAGRKKKIENTRNTKIVTVGKSACTLQQSRLQNELKI